MKDRQIIKDKHENAVIQQFVTWWNKKNNLNYEITEKPDPPDAIIMDGKEISWIEHTDLYGDRVMARNEITLLAKDEKHKPHDPKVPFIEPDLNIASELINRIEDKLSKKSYKSWKQKYGKGYLIISERDPFFDEESINEIINIIRNKNIANDRKYFKGVYLAIRNNGGLKFGEIRYSTNSFSRVLSNFMLNITKKSNIKW